jgi:hypothetical protein
MMVAVGRITFLSVLLSCSPALADGLGVQARVVSCYDGDT